MAILPVLLGTLGAMDASSLLDEAIATWLQESAKKLEEEFNADVLSYVGPIHEAFLRPFRDFIEHIAKATDRKNLALFLNTGGGSVQAAEKMVEIMRHHYSDVSFVVPDMAMSAGTVLAMSGNRIFMDYSSSLGPIDPQVLVRRDEGETWVPALGYLDKVEELIKKSADGTLTPAEYVMLKELDLAILRAHEQAKDLSIQLMKDWLVTYKFKTWTKHRTDPSKKGKPVTNAEKQQRAEEIAAMFCDNKLWHSHGRLIGIGKLTGILRLEIDDYSSDDNRRSLIRSYHDVLTDFMARTRTGFCIHSAHRSTL